MFRTTVARMIQASGILLRLENDRMDRVRLLKLLYIADREALAETGKPIVGGRLVAMKNGPLHSEVYDLVKSEHEGYEEWNRFFRNDGHVVTCLSDPGRLQLSPYEIDKLTDVSERHVGRDTWAVAEVTHQFPEWQRFHRPGTSCTIPLEALLAELGFTDEEVREVVHDAEMQQRLHALLGSR